MIKKYSQIEIMILFSPCGQSVDVQDGLVDDFIRYQGYRRENPRPYIPIAVEAIAPQVEVLAVSEIDSRLQPQNLEPVDAQPIENLNLLDINKAPLKALTELAKQITIADAKKIVENRPYKNIESVIAVGGELWYSLRDKLSF